MYISMCKNIRNFCLIYPISIKNKKNKEQTNIRIGSIHVESSTLYFTINKKYIFLFHIMLYFSTILMSLQNEMIRVLKHGHFFTDVICNFSKFVFNVIQEFVVDFYIIQGLFIWEAVQVFKVKNELKFNKNSYKLWSIIGFQKAANELCRSTISKLNNKFSISK